MSSHTHPGIVLLQVVRYHRSGDPLLVSEEGIPSASDVPKCECGAARIFEFQVMCVCECMNVCVCVCECMNVCVCLSVYACVFVDTQRTYITHYEHITGCHVYM